MKTYWLEKREMRSQSTKNISIQQPPQWHNNSRHNSITRNSLDASPKLTMTPTTPPRLPSKPPVSPTSISRPDSVLASISPAHIVDDRHLYSPVTFQDVARRSAANSPANSPTKCLAEKR